MAGSRLALADRLEPGLASFGADDADLFIGRETVGEPCLDRFGAERFVTGGAVWGWALDVTPPGPAHTGAGPQRIAISFEGRISPTNQ